MLVFPNSKINLGLNVVEKRGDGFHNIETIFYPINWCDALEIVPSNGTTFELQASGLHIEGDLEQNILFKAYSLLKLKHKLPPFQVFLHKSIPMGAGLGGGSADAAFFLKLMNQKFGLKVTTEELTDMARQLGSDCAFFIENIPVYASRKGDVFEKINVGLGKYFLLMVYPGINSNTKEAYNGIIPSKPQRSVKEIVLNEKIDAWKNILVNDFEKSVFKKYPEIEELKSSLYKNGAIYAAMSGSGSAVFGIFEEKPELQVPENYLWHLQEPS
jgi:4-diphosphocytidyl-2-C-methyl-D-erythritol kinase